MKSTFFDHLGYLSACWKKKAAKVDQTSLKMWWDGEECVPVCYGDMSIKMTPTFNQRKSQIAEDDHDLQCNRRNMAKLKAMAEKLTHLSLWAGHDVKIRQGEQTFTKGRKNTSPNLPTRKLCRVFNLIEVAAKLLAVYPGMGSNTVSQRSYHRTLTRCALR